MTSLKPQLLLKAQRGDITEREHFGYVLLADQNAILKEIGNCKADNFSLRSCQKPFQALPLINSNAFTDFNFTLKELAICCASHAGSPVHTDLVQSVLSKIRLSEKDLKCGVHAPLDKATKLNLEKNDTKPNQMHNNCSGKHAGMLAVCRQNNWDIESYLDLDHPLQQEILKIVKNYCELNTDPPLGIDGCGTPVYAMPLANMAKGYLNLFLSEEGRILKEAFQQNPYVIGGNERLDTAIIEASKGSLVAKVGAEGLCIIVNPQTEQVLVLKILDASMPARGMVVINALLKLNWITKSDSDSKYLKDFYELDINALNGKKVGQYEICFDF